MKKVMVVVILLVATVGYAGDWTKEDTYREIAFTGLLTIDYLQTRTIVNNPDKYFERNPIESRHPSQKSVDIYMASCAILHPVVSYLLPQKSEKWKWMNRENWQYITIAIEAGSTAYNLSLGISF